MDSPFLSFETEGDRDAVAARAVAVLATGEVGDAELTRIREWLRADVAHREAFDRARRAWAASNAIISAARGAVDARKPLHRRIPPRFAIGAGALLAACLVFVAILPNRDLLSTGAGEVKRIDLPDGTVAWLDGASALRLDYGSDLRRVELVRGRASFSVRHDANRPFEVATQGARARDLGTEFSINRTTDGATLTVREGIVRVDGQGAAVTLRAGEATHWRTAEAVPAPAVPADADAALSWRDGRLVFERVTLENALDEIGRHRRPRLWLLDSALARRPVSGVVFDSRIEEGLDTVAAGANVRLVRLPFVTLVFGG
ncbi:MAG: FecR domain-containing protein [Gammaproteobacteria bacterium]